MSDYPKLSEKGQRDIFCEHVKAFNPLELHGVNVTLFVGQDVNSGLLTTNICAKTPEGKMYLLSSTTQKILKD